MAESEQVPDLDLDSQQICDYPSIVDDQVHVVTAGLSDELVHQALVQANDFDSSTIRSIYAVANGEEATEVVEGMELDECGDRNENVGKAQTSNKQNISELSNLTTTNGSILCDNTELKFTNCSAGTDADTLLSNDCNSDTDVLGIGIDNGNGTFTVDIGSLQDNQIISVPGTNVMQQSVIMSHQSSASADEPLPQTNGGTSEILTVENQELIHQINSQYIQQEESNILHEDSTIQILQSDAVGCPQAIRVTAPHGLTMTQEVLQNVIQQVQAQQLAQQQSVKNQNSSHTVPMNQNCENDTVSFALVSPNQSTSPQPLGSSQNPIRIIQQGNRYTPVQQLSSDQLQQIMQVVQQQHVTKSSEDNGGTVIFNPQTNTRIMYRVIYPSELHKAQSSSNQGTYQVVRPLTSEHQANVIHHKRPYHKRKDKQASTPNDEENSEKQMPDGPELSKEEKEERKKHRPRTRSGRVSKPPKHMVADYKHIHVLDFDEDYDDSDGGYSDYKHSDEEGKVKRERSEDASLPDLFGALGAGKPKNHKCQTCDKSYIGQAGLARHYRLNPDHCITPMDSSLHNGSYDGDDSKEASFPDGSISLMSDLNHEAPKRNHPDNYSEDSNTQDSVNSTGASSPVVRRGRGRGRGRGAHFRHNAHLLRKNKLKELMKRSTDEELMEVVLPRLVSGVSLWEFLLMKSEKGGTKPQVDVIYKEFESLKRRVKKVCNDHLKPLSLEELEDDNLQCKMIKVSDSSLASCLGLETVTYRVEEMAQEDTNTFSSLHNKLSAAAIHIAPRTQSDIPAKSFIKVENQDFGETNDNSVDLATPTNGILKRELAFLSPDSNESSSKKSRLSSCSPWEPMEVMSSNTSSVAASSAIFTVSAHLPSNSEDKLNIDRSDSSLSTFSSISASSAPSPKSQAIAVTRESPLPSSSSLSTSTSKSLPFVTSVKSETVTSPMHFSLPVSKPQTVSYIIKANGKPNTNTVITSNRSHQQQTMPVLFNTGAGQSSSQVLPYILGGTGSVRGPHRVVIAAPQQSNQREGLPIVISPSETHTQNNTVLLSPGSGLGPHRMIVRQPCQQSSTSLPTQVIFTSPQQTAPSKSENSIFINHNFSPPKSSDPPSTKSPNHTLHNLKPTEVKVSRQLFHDTTASLVSTSSLINGKGCAVSESLSTDKPDFISHNRTSINNDLCSIQSELKMESNDLPLLQSSEHSFITDVPSNEVNVIIGEKHEHITDPDLDVLSSAGVLNLSGDDLASLNTSTDSLNVGLTDDLTLIQSQTADVSMSQETCHISEDPQSVIHLSNGNVPVANGISLVNSNSVDIDFDTSKDKNISSNNIKVDQLTSLSASTTSQSTSLASPVSELMNIIKPSSSVVSSPTKEPLCSLTGTSINIGTNGAISSHILKTDDMSSLQLNNSSDSNLKNIKDPTGSLTGDQVNEDDVNILPQQLIDVSDNTELDSSCDPVLDSLGTEGEDTQPLLSEGTNIYQTEDGTLIIQCADGNTYQLQGAQGLSLETVQALLSGTMDQLVVDSGTESQSEVQLH